MNADKTLPTILLIAFIVFSIPAGLYFRNLPPQTPPPLEAELAKFTSQPVAMSSPQPRVVFSGLRNPVTPVQQPKPTEISSGKSAPTTPAQTVTPNSARKSQPRSLASLPVISMISYDGYSRTAIIDNQIVTEGSKFGSGVIVKIEETRVLMRKAGRDIWLTTN